ncbi:GNAT family N-acetyltransferase [Colwellia sp. 1_MG-2023]|uniref:GNAT family N-acetyltransferase n=1 Tax=Colwellia sp. 1_MG-2023 TaxID=3062649 RepID=UPI0026E3D6A9|nr:GNAT family N-acetyltransferase [Colwellia sp. 1_MG-2023]MDO6444979.1 GNAT family N-acetyltransferase [Colwellia sp. 1_MG-2023]
MKQVKVVKLSLTEFIGMEDEWTKCLLDSEANPLFSSWIWQKSWWDIWQARLSLDLLLLGIYQENTLIGIAPCYTYSVKRLGFINTQRCEFIGNFSHNDDSIRSEYLNFILPKGRYDELLPVILTYIQAQQIDEIVLTDINANSSTVDFLIRNYPSCEKKQEEGVCINTNKQFTTYLSSLGKNTRLKLFNRRKLLNKPKLITITQTDEINYFFESLNKMHITRWGKVCFSSHSEKFHQIISKYFLKQDCLALSVLYDDNNLLAVCYDISIENTRYNIQLGFTEYPNNKVSLGTLMLGYSIEKAHEDPVVEKYDLLAGSGKNTFYKKHFQGETHLFMTLSIPVTYKIKCLHQLKATYRTLKALLISKS